MTGLLRLEGRNAAARISALVRLAVLPMLFLFEGLETPAAPPDLPIGEPLLAVLFVYAVVAAVVAFAARRDLPAAPFAIADIALVSLLVFAEGGALADIRFVLFVPVLVAVLSGPRLTFVVGALSVAGFVAAAVASARYGAPADTRIVVVHGLDMAWRAALAVAVAVLLARRAERNRRLAESRRSLVTQALEAEARARRDLSYALHDELVQALLCAQQDLKVARRGRAEYIDRADHALDDAVRRLRHEIFQLHPHVLETAGLQTALAAVAAQGVRPDAAPPVVAVAPDAAGVDDELLFSLGRELLTNVARHAGARHVELTVERAGESLGAALPRRRPRHGARAAGGGARGRPPRARRVHRARRGGRRQARAGVGGRRGHRGACDRPGRGPARRRCGEPSRQAGGAVRRRSGLRVDRHVGGAERVNGSRRHPAHRCSSRMPASRAIRSSSAGHA